MTFHAETNVAPERLLKLLSSKEELALFRPNKPLEGPDVASGEIVKEVETQFGIAHPDRLQGEQGIALKPTRA